MLLNLGACLLPAAAAGLSACYAEMHAQGHCTRHTMLNGWQQGRYTQRTCSNWRNTGRRNRGKASSPKADRSCAGHGAWQRHYCCWADNCCPAGDAAATDEGQTTFVHLPICSCRICSCCCAVRRCVAGCRWCGCGCWRGRCVDGGAVSVLAEEAALWQLVLQLLAGSCQLLAGTALQAEHDACVVHLATAWEEEWGTRMARQEGQGGQCRAGGWHGRKSGAPGWQGQEGQGIGQSMGLRQREQQQGLPAGSIGGGTALAGRGQDSWQACQSRQQAASKHPPSSLQACCTPLLAPTVSTVLGTAVAWPWLRLQLKLFPSAAPITSDLPSPLPPTRL